MSNDIIKDIKISGDFFGNAPVSELEAVISGVEKSGLADILKNIDTENYICGMSAEMLVRQIQK